MIGNYVAVLTEKVKIIYVVRSLCTPENELYRDVNKTGSYQVSMAYGFLSRVEFSRRVMLLASDSPYGLGIACAAA